MVNFFELHLLPLFMIFDEAKIHGAICVGETCTEGKRLVRKYLSDKPEPRNVLRADIQFYWDHIRGNNMLIHGYNPDDPEHRALLSSFSRPSTPLCGLSLSRKLSSDMLIDWALKSPMYPMYFEENRVGITGGWGKDVSLLCQVASLTDLQKFCDRLRFSDREVTACVLQWLIAAEKNRDSSVLYYLLDKCSQALLDLNGSAGNDSSSHTAHLVNIDEINNGVSSVACNLAKENKLDLLKYLVELFEWTSADDKGWYRVSVAAKKGHLDVVKYLIEKLHIKNVSQSSHELQSCFNSACRGVGTLPVVCHLVSLMFEHNFATQAALRQGIACACAPGCGADLEIVRFLVDRSNLTVEQLLERGMYGSLFSTTSAYRHFHVAMFFIKHFNLKERMAVENFPTLIMGSIEEFDQFEVQVFLYYHPSGIE